MRFEEVSLSCGNRVILTEDMNDVIVESPNYPSPSPINVECEWVILAPSGHSLQMDITDTFDIAGYPS